jgi:hypothetical protein
MNLIIIGVDHVVQTSDDGWRAFLRALMESEAITLIGEERPHGSVGVAQELAASKGVPWLQADMNSDERYKAGINSKLLNRMQIRGYDENLMPILAHRYAPGEDGIREDHWIDRIAEQQVTGTAALVCGALRTEGGGESPSARLRDEIDVLSRESGIAILDHHNAGTVLTIETLQLGLVRYIVALTWIGEPPTVKQAPGTGAAHLGKKSGCPRPKTRAAGSKLALRLAAWDVSGKTRKKRGDLSIHSA